MSLLLVGVFVGQKFTNYSQIECDFSIHSRCLIAQDCANDSATVTALCPFLTAQLGLSRIGESIHGRDESIRSRCESIHGWDESIHRIGTTRKFPLFFDSYSTHSTQYSTQSTHYSTHAGVNRFMGTVNRFIELAQPANSPYFSTPIRLNRLIIRLMPA